MELQQLKYFRAVAEEQSFTRAARRLFVTQPNVSIQIRKLEHELGTSLFERGPGCVTLSEAGEVLNDCALSIFSTLDDTMSRLRTLDRDLAPPLRIGYLPSLGRTVMPSIVVHIRRAAPEIALSIEEIADSGRIATMLTDAELDIGVARMACATGDSRVLFTEEFVVACPARGPLRELDFRDTEVLAGTPLVLPAEGIGLRTQILDICRSLGFTPRVVLEARSLDLLLGAVASGVGISVLPRLCMAKETEVVPVGLGPLAATRTISMAWRRQANPFQRHPQLAGCLAGSSFVSDRTPRAG
jgi:DNA-binding transcriptional LysR family regulator